MTGYCGGSIWQILRWVNMTGYCGQYDRILWWVNVTGYCGGSM